MGIRVGKVVINLSAATSMLGWQLNCHPNIKASMEILEKKGQLPLCVVNSIGLFLIFFLHRRFFSHLFDKDATSYLSSRYNDISCRFFEAK
jgi:hypothetical protein